jgi:6-phosphogluconolactonase
MLRSFGSVTVLAVLMVGCGGGGGGVVPQPPGTISGTVSGLLGSGLTLAVCHSAGGPGGVHTVCNSQQQARANGALTLYPSYPADNSGSYNLAITNQPSSPAQRCKVAATSFTFQTANSTSFTVSCADLLEYSYVTNAAANTLSSYSVDVTTGAVTVLGTPTPTGGASPYATAGFEYAGQRFVFVGNEGSDDVSVFAADATTGALTAVPGSPFLAGKNPQAMAVDNSSLDLYVANAGSDNVSAYTIDTSTGALTALPGSPLAVGKGPTSIVFDYDGGIVFVANHGGSNDISAFYNYDLTPVSGSPFPAGGNPLSLALGAQGRFLYSANPDATNPSISGFSVDPNIAPLTGSPFPIPVSHYIATDQTGSYLYVTSGANILGYAIDVTTGALIALPGFPVATGANAYSITVNPSNQILYVTNEGAATVSAFALDASTGALTPMAGSPFPAGSQPQFIATF